MKKFDYSFLNIGLLPANLVNLTFNIATLKTMAGACKDEDAKILKAVAKVQSITNKMFTRVYSQNSLFIRSE